ncbi:hypothetical protein T552_03024 [Pneumocystis carinii B80]|uniref:aspartyl aminopeptidase n=1 Tax=Pneumocystis carinii (strain B80) TaxID=1408658 RepID=A0A0W4ZCH4_PNEC8|nr:hypothetical protein T552_03024 [Pneumocystis carinii B80]KTW26130.1 hypothetical protein T552_03024 [Pneumocystis carinii B80]
MSPDVLTNCSYAYDFLRFLHSSPTPYHVVNNIKNTLISAGFEELKERDPFEEQVEPGKMYFITRNTSSLIAFSIGKEWRPGGPIALAGAHTDSPTLRIKPISKRISEKYLQVGVETYGGGIWHTWFDRDLGMAGRVMVAEANGLLKQYLVDIDDPVLRIPSLAIHLDREMNQKLEFDKEAQLLPILGEKSSNEDSKSEEILINELSRHHKDLLALIAQKLSININQIRDFEIILRDTQPPCFGGVNKEYIFSGKLDDQDMCFCILHGFLESFQCKTLVNADTSIKIISFFDHEEIGSISAHGAQSTFLPLILRRLFNTPIAKKYGDLSSFEQSIARSLLVSADMSHAVHPNYASKHESMHKPKINKGLVLKINANQRYATDAPGILILREVAKKVQANLQLFVTSNSIPSGSTIGPGLSASLGIRTIDVGNPQLSMHSIREMAGTADINNAILFFKSYFENYASIQKQIMVD